jgi:hypothetical protein
MKHGSTLFLKIVIYVIGAAVLALCASLLYVGVFNDNTGYYLPIFLLINITALPFLFALYQGLLLLSYIDKNTAFSDLSVKAIQKIRYSAFTISALYAAGMPYIFWAAEQDDAPGAVVIGLVFIFAPLVVAVFAAVLQKLLKNAIDIKSENELTV